MPSHRLHGPVAASGFDSAKGQLIRSIIFPRPNPFTFYRDSFRFVAVMGGIGTDAPAVGSAKAACGAADPPAGRRPNRPCPSHR